MFIQAEIFFEWWWLEGDGKYVMHNHKLDKELVGHANLGRLKEEEIKFVNDMTKYNMAPRYIMSALKDKYPKKPHEYYPSIPS